MPVIAAVHGFAVGGGFQLALAADMRYVARAAKFSIMEVKWGLVPDMGATQLMCHLAREDVVRDLSYTGRVFDGQQAFEFGFATQICSDPVADGLAAAKAISAQSPDAVRALKRLFNGVYDASARRRLLEETVEQQALVGTPNQVETVRADIEKRPTVFVDPQLRSFVG